MCFMDVEMPHMGGFEAVREFREWERRNRPWGRRQVRRSATAKRHICVHSECVRACVCLMFVPPSPARVLLQIILALTTLAVADKLGSFTEAGFDAAVHKLSLIHI